MEEEETKQKNNLEHDKERNRKISQNVENMVKNKMKKKSSLMVPIAHMIIPIAIFLIFIIILIGIILFLITMPGTSMEKLKQFGRTVGQNICSWFGVDSTTQVEDAKIYETLDYLESMGYDLKGFGFLTTFYDDDGDEDGVERNNEGNISKAESEFIYTYLVSDNYVYTIKNKNTSNIFSNAQAWYAKVFGGITAIGQHLIDFITNGHFAPHWTRGLIGIYYDTGTIGKKGSYYQEGLFNLSDISIDVEKKEMTVKKGLFTGSVKYNLDGWTGRYGMPIDFLLAIHVATMMPDLAFDMATTFDTEITMLLHSHKVSVTTTDEKTGLTETKQVDTYEPYLAYVKDHWYRDVYFVAEDDSQKFVDYDYDYESVVRERWTLYETYEDGSYKLYKIDGNGNLTDELYNGTEEEAQKEGLTVGKKAETIKIQDEMEDLGWNDTNGVLSVYKYNNGILTQTGEGQRTETNSKIKKIFLENKYFKYDGTRKTAETINKLRNTLSEDKKYGAIDDSDLKKSVKIDGMDNTIKDHSGIVSLNQDSLNAFSMLENEHTLDADYIYRDFKELIVELGYFQKEELTEGTPRLLEWLIPEIASYGFPKRELDKNEIEFGTMVHSKQDFTSYDTLHKDDEENLQLNTSEGGSGDALDPEDPDIVKKKAKKKQKAEVQTKNSLVSLSVSQSQENNVLTAENQSQTNITDNVGAGGGKITEDFDEAGWDESKAVVEKYATSLNINTISNYYAKNNEQQYENFMNSLGGVFAKYGGKDKKGIGDSESLMEAEEYVYSTMWLLGFDYCAYTGGSGYDFSRCTPLLGSNTPYTAFPNGGSAPHHSDPYHTNGAKLLDDCMLNYKFVTNCNYTVDKVMYEAGLFGGEDQPHSSCRTKDLIEDYGGEPVWEIKDLHFGDIIECYGSVGDRNDISTWSGWYHVMYVGEETEDTVTIYQTGHDFTNDGSWRCELDKDAPRSEMPAEDGWVGIHLWDLDYNGGQKYKGYKGNEAVVSPVTGILLDYGTYDEHDIDSLTKEQYRINTDLRYNNKESMDVSDKVGYAKILVLDTENYLKLEKTMNTEWKNNSLFQKNKDFYKDDLNTTDELKEMNNIEKTVYGYKEFVESYHDYGISGYILYIDGFSCELPGEEDENGIVTTEQALSRDYFIEKAMKPNSSGDFEDELESKYEKPSSYKLASKKATEKLKAETNVRDESAHAVYLNGSDLLILKEGTVIGRTYTDEEIYKMRQENPNTDYCTKYTLKDRKVKDSEDNPVIQGNYVRIIMRDLDDTVVENVEDYIKLAEDDGTETQAGNQEYQFQEGDIELLADAIHHEGCGSYDDPSGSKDDQLYLAKSVGFTIINKLNSDSGYNHVAGWGWAPSKSQLYNLVCVVPCAAHGGNGWYAISDDPTSTMGGIKNRADAGQYEYCDMCMEAAEYIKENDSLNFKNNGKYQSQFSSGTAMPHTCWEQGAGYYGGQIWAHFRNDYLFIPPGLGN